MACCSQAQFNHRLGRFRRFRKRAGVRVRTARMKTLFAVIFTLLLCGGADVQGHFHIVDRRELNLRCSCSSFDARQPIFLLDLKTLQTKRTLRPLSNCTKFRRRMSRFPARRCIKEYKTILFRKKKTPAGGNHPGRPGNFHPNICANHYHL